MSFLKKIIPIWLAFGVTNAVAIPLILNNSKVSEAPKSMLSLIIPKTPTEKAPKPIKESERIRQQKNFLICQRSMSWSYCRSKYYWHE